MENNKELLDITFRFETFPPSLNRLLNGETQAYIDWLAYSAQLISDQYNRKYSTLYDKRVFAVVRLYLNDFSTKDIDNYIKAPVDALKGTVIKDDETVDLLIIYKLKGKPYRSSILELQVVDMEKPIILADLIPKSDYIWMREKNSTTLREIVTAQAKIGSGTNAKEKNIHEKCLENFKKQDTNFKKLFGHLCGNPQLNDAERKSFFNKKKKVAFCVLLMKKIEYNGGKVLENYKTYHDLLEKRKMLGASMSKAEFEIWYNSEYKQEVG